MSKEGDLQGPCSLADKPSPYMLNELAVKKQMIRKLLQRVASLCYVGTNFVMVSSFSYCMQETVTVGVDGSVLDRIAKIMAYLRLGSSGKVLKKKKKEKDPRGKRSI